VVGIGALVIALTWLVASGDHVLPRLFLNDSEITPLGHYVTAFDLLVGVVAFALLWKRSKSVLDLWLMVALAALIAELAIVALFIEARFNFGFYFSRLFAIVSALAVLIALLAELANLYGGLSRTVTKLRLERESKLLSLETLIGTTAHEIKQPLTAIALEGNTALRLLTAATPDLDEVRSGLHTIVADAFRGAEMLRKMRDLLTPADRQLQLLSMNDVVLEALSVMDRELKDHAIVVRGQLAPNLPWITAHKGQMLQVLINLFTNAIEAMVAMPGARILRVSSALRGKSKISITVEDTGPGLPAGLTDSIFDPLVTTKPSSMGLGLALCQTIVERHEGAITVFSEAGIGARFQVTLTIKPH
jgi:signal transduction histidine kinase